MEGFWQGASGGGAEFLAESAYYSEEGEGLPQGAPGFPAEAQGIAQKFQ